MLKIMASFHIKAYSLNAHGECVPPVKVEKPDILVAVDAESVEDARLKIEKIYSEVAQCLS